MTPVPRKLFLDDERKPSGVNWVELPLSPWSVVRSYDEFVKWVTVNGVPEFVTFDHYLNDVHYKVITAHTQASRLGLDDNDFNKNYENGRLEKTGYHAARWLVEHCLDNNVPIPDYQVHSMNPIGVENIKSAMESGKKVQNL